jgi:hypothetical protein
MREKIDSLIMKLNSFANHKMAHLMHINFHNVQELNINLSSI